MIEVQTLDQENLDANKIISLAPAEVKFFKEELDRQLENGNSIDLLKALHNARYLAKLEISEKNFKEGHYIEFTDENWEKFMNEQDFEVNVGDKYKIQLAWDDEAKVWMATSEDIPGLILEDELSVRLIKRVIVAAPEIIELNSAERAALA